MKIYTLSRTQHFKVPIETLWDFMSDPSNLSRITPPDMGFRITKVSLPGRTYAGQLISYTVGIFPGIRTGWVTEITHVREPYFFVDEQRFGPYALWHHQHELKEENGGVTMIDEVNYKVPFGLLGKIIHWLYIRKKLESIFDYRRKTLESLFQN